MTAGRERTVYRAQWVLPIATPPIEGGAVVVEGMQIAWVGPAQALPTAYANAVTVDCGDAALLPGLVNAHTHLELTLLRGFLEGLEFRTWLRTLNTVRSELFTEQDLLDASRLGLVEALRHGITTVADCTDSAAPLTAMRELGVRGIGYVEVFGPDPAQRDASLGRLAARVAALRVHDTALVRTGVSPHAPYTVSAPLFRAVADLARHEALPVAVHVAESAAETAFVCEGLGPFADGQRARGIAVAPQAASPVQLLEDTGMLAVQPLCIHVVRASDHDLARIAAHGATIVHCPISNAKLGHGTAPLARMLAHGIATGLGTDSVASNDRMHLLDEARQATLLHAATSGVPDSLSAHAALDLATRGGARALGMADRVGTLEAGKEADLAVFPLDDIMVQPVHDPAVALVHALAGHALASLVVVAGHVVARHGVPTAYDPAWQARAKVTGDRLREWRHRTSA